MWKRCMSKISLENESYGRENARYELKMVCQEDAYFRVRAALRLHPMAIRPLYSPRKVQSVYLDTLGRAALEDNLAGISHREKIRFRWYGEEARGVKGQLENKIRENMQGWKQILKINKTFDVEGQNSHGFLSKLREEATPGWKVRLSRGLYPVQWIQYEREYYATHHKRIRITLDRKLRAWDQRGRVRLSSRFHTPIPRFLVVEMKCSAHDFDAAQDLARSLPIPVDKCSKFVTASMPDEGPMVSLLLPTPSRRSRGDKDG